MLDPRAMSAATPLPLSRSFLLAVAVIATVLLGAAPAMAAPPAPDFGPQIEGYAAYDGQDTCSPSAKPGAVGLRSLLLETYPTSGSSGISRDCDVGGKSEHKEGRAFDWRVNVSEPDEVAAAEDFLSFILATDRHGNPHAYARRMGIMYMVWNRRIFRMYRPGAGWQPYGGDSPHTDHVHFSMSRAGGAGQTSWWTAGPPAAPAPPPTSTRVERTSGSTRIQTAIATSLRGWRKRGSSRRVVVASADRWPDAVVGGGVAGRYEAPLLLTGGGRSIEGDVQDEIRRVLGDASSNKEIILVGGTGALPSSKTRASRLEGRYAFRRIGGSHRYSTSRAAARSRRERSTGALLVTGDSYVDALPMVAVAAQRDWPIILTEPGRLNPHARWAIDGLDVEQVHIAGPPSGVSDAVAEEVRRRPTVKTVERHFAETRHHTSAAIGNRFFPNPNWVAAARGDDWPDGVTGGVLVGDNGGPLLLASRDDLTAPVIDYVRGRADSETLGIIVGGDKAVGLRPEQQLRALLP